ncbi:MAG: leucine-rich repeat domain-containing protein, partial [Clostridiaceae bacterium]|nr:leucine-rich repeat domain-containing protein [Clostridiaceae bacterium]
MFYRYADDYQEMYRKVVTAYTANIPIYVNGYDINKSSYPAINYRPFSDRPYYSYVPVASFYNVGAKVVYDSQANVINVTTDYYTNKQIIEEQQAKISELQSEIDKLQPQPIPTDSTIITLEDKNLENAIRLIINKPIADLHMGDVDTITELNFAGSEITNLSGIENFVSLKSFYLTGYNNKISDIGPLKGLTNLKELQLSDNQISDISPLQS